jgi:hypothetical protein
MAGENFSAASWQSARAKESSWPGSVVSVPGPGDSGSSGRVGLISVVGQETVTFVRLKSSSTAQPLALSLTDRPIVAVPLVISTELT